MQYYKPHNLMALCNQSDDSKLTVGSSYTVSKICVMRAETRFFLDILS